jgi:lipopolysaccharide export system permease protein
VIINRALVGEVLRTSIAVTVVIVSIFMVVRLMSFLQAAADGVVPVDAVLTLVALKMLAYLDVILPLMFYIALLMVLGRWYRDNEMAVLASSGFGITKLLKPLAFLVLLMGILVGTFAFYVTPQALAMGYTIEGEFRQSTEVSGITPGEFMETKKGSAVYFVERLNREENRYENIFIYKSSFQREGVVVSDIGYRTIEEETGEQFLILKNGTRYEGTPGTPSYRVIDFETYALRIETPAQGEIALPIRARPNVDLYTSDDPHFRGEWFWRVAKVFVLPVLAVFGLALSFVDSRRGKATGMVLAFLVYLLYTNLLGYAVALVKKGEVESGMYIWSVHIMFGMLAIYCLYRRNYNLPLFPNFLNLAELIRRRAAT